MDTALENGHHNNCNLCHFTHDIHLCPSELQTHMQAQTYILRSLPQLGESLQKTNWQKCLWKLNIRSVRSDPGWAV